MLQAAFMHGLAGQLENASVPLTTPPGEVVHSASIGHVGVDERRTRSSTPTQRAFSTQEQQQ
eukprot:2260952-Prorocentrum_lima.AAC.1